MSKLYVGALSKDSDRIDDSENTWVPRGEKNQLDEPSFHMICAICGNPFKAKISELHPGVSDCKGCKSSVRWRSVAVISSILLSGSAVALPMLPPRPDVSVLGMSCPKFFSDQLEKKVNLWNTFYDQEPRFDITAVSDPNPGPFDLVISVEVMEHIAPPVSLGFQNLFKLLKPGGVLLLTVPFANKGDTLEHFPNLYDYHLETRGKDQVLVNVTQDGQEEEFGDLVFHGGRGFTLEMRRFARQGLISELTNSGFNDIQFFEAPFFPLGVYFKRKWSLPLVAVKPWPLEHQGE